MTVTCPDCGKEFPQDDARYQGHRGYHKAHPESIKQKKETAPSSTGSAPSAEKPQAPPPTPSTGKPTPLEPVSFSFSPGERLPNQEEIPEFKSPEETEKEEKEGTPTKEKTLAEERASGESALGALILPLFEMWNRSVEGVEGVDPKPEDLRLNKNDAELLAKALVLVDAKHGGPISKTLGGETGPEIFLAGVCIGMGVKMFMQLRVRASKNKRPKSAAPSPEEIPRKNPLQTIGENLTNLIGPKKEKKEEGPPTIEGEVKMSPEQFMKEAEEYQKRAIGP